MHDLPDGPALLAFARAVLLEELLPLLPPERRLDARLIANCMAVAAREAEADPRRDGEIGAALATLYEAGATALSPSPTLPRERGREEPGCLPRGRVEGDPAFHPHETAPFPRKTAPLPREAAPLPREAAPLPRETAPLPREAAPLPRWRGRVREGVEAASPATDSLLRRFARDLRIGAFDNSEPRAAAARAILWRMTIERLRLANPRFLAANGMADPKG